MTEKCCNGCPCGKLGVIHSAVTGAITLGIIFVACWLGTFTAMPVTHAFIPLFTLAPIASPTALAEGLSWSLVFGAWAGLVLAIVSNFVSRFTRPS